MDAAGVPGTFHLDRDNRYNDRFTDLSFEAIERRYGDERRMLEEVLSIDPPVFPGRMSCPTRSSSGNYHWPLRPSSFHLSCSSLR